MHQRNKHKERYDFRMLLQIDPTLRPFVKENEKGDGSINFFDPKAVKALNKALLKLYYGIDEWDIPENYLCPPVPGRADYIHHIADLLNDSTLNSVTKGNSITCLDIGTGANCIYPIIGIKEYGWHFLGSDTDPVAIQSASKIVESNAVLKGKIDLRLQLNPNDIFKGILKKNEHIDVSICNPPFHSSAEEARKGSIKKLENLKGGKVNDPVLNFSGKSNELWCSGGEERFVRNMIFESKQFAGQCSWFSSLVAKKEHLKRIYNALEKVEAVEVKTIPVDQGNKTSRIVAWT
ncbi:MAG TPA: 23S rRNA (adenine(1618)-N(6))-methyltransferase RlmF, partial [Bacteroidia bacterium]|nr:23S rRNA (adenine(1618)-N(6))-methyltransferase RlmF [Bacteroidia bacterium]